MDATITPEIDALINHLHARGRLRVWSIIISIFGDSIQPHGRMVSASTLGAILEGLKIEPGAMRSALSRLGKEGWIIRHKVGRTSRYSLTEKGLATFVPAAQRIYSASGPQNPDVWTLALVPGCCADKKARLNAGLLQQGFQDLGRGAFVFAGGKPAETAELSECLVLTGQIENIPDTVKTALATDADYAAFQDILTVFSPLQAALSAGAQITPQQAITARTLLIHDWRRAVLRHAGLPAGFYPDDWPAETCRAFVAGLYQALTPAAEAWLDSAPELVAADGAELRSRFHADTQAY